jgi:broad specificity phosphatase PhoE
MTSLRRLALPFLVLAGGAALAAAPPPAADVYVMRHLQKEAGEDPGLTAVGKANAERLAGWFGANAPRAIYVSTTRRARETAAPLARKLHLEPKEYGPADVAGLVARVRQETGPVLVVGHSNTVPDIVERLGGARPSAIADDSFGDIWRVAPRGAVEKKSLGGR